MKQELSCKIGGQQGEGIESVGDILSTVLHRQGYFLYCQRHFSSRIKGGHTNYTIRIALQQMRSINEYTDILIAFDQETIDLGASKLKPDSIIIADSKSKPVNPHNKARILSIPLTETAVHCGATQMKNIVALGSASVLLGILPGHFTPVIENLLKKKGPEVISNNLHAFQEGVRLMREHGEQPGSQFHLPPAVHASRLFLMGNEAIALGALAAGSKFMAAYPITPASDIMEYLSKKLPELGGAVIQTEDEIAACLMALGANYAGARAFTATSGPGFSLMAESIGLAAMTETPLVVIDTQRGGPSTGLPTKQEQSDLMAAIYNTHGDVAKIVLAPGTVEEAFYDTFTAFNLAEEYQCPVILLTDLNLSLNKETVAPFDFASLTIKRGNLQQENALAELKQPDYFRRYAVTEEGISPRVIPGTPNGLHLTTGLEHDEVGKPSETAANRKTQSDKRLRKLSSVPYACKPFYTDTQTDNPDLLIVGMSSTRGPIEEAIATLRQEGFYINHLHLRLLHPFPTEQFLPFYTAAKKVLIVENNATAQLAELISAKMPDRRKIISCTQYDGNAFYASTIYEKAKEVF